MSSRAGPGIPAAAGYPQYSGSLIAPKFGQDLIERFYCSTVFGEITTTDYIGELKSCGDQISFWEEPTVAVHDYVKDGTIKHDTFESKQIVLSIDKAKQFSIKLDMIDEHQICNIDMWKNKLMVNASRAMADHVDCSILSTLYTEAAKFNRGAAAGKCTGCFDLGEVGAPLSMNADNVLDVLADLATVLDEACVPREGRWIVVPPKFENLLRRAENCKLCFTGLSDANLMNGKIPTMIGGFNIFVSNKVPMSIDPITNEPVFNLVAGWKGAAVFAAQLERTRIIEDKDTWDTYYQGFMVWGSGVVKHDGLAHLYVTFAG
jgi:hypothetical protein